MSGSENQNRRILPTAAWLLVFVIGAWINARASSSPPRKASGSKTKAAAEASPSLPPLGGTEIRPLPPGAAKATADAACFKCHSSDLVRQQRLTEKQWGAVVKKMLGWGAEVSDEKTAALVTYLSKNFGPDNPELAPTPTLPAR